MPSSSSSLNSVNDEKAQRDEEAVSNAAALEPVRPKAEANMIPEVDTPSPEVQKDVERGDPQKPTGPPVFDPASFPDGGRDAWLCVLGGFCALFCSFGWINCIGVFQDYYQVHQLRAYSPSTVAWIPSLEAFMMFFGGPIVGKLYDSYGPRYILLFGTFFNVLGLMMTSISSEYYQFILAQGICNPLGASCVFYPAMSTVSSWFFKRRALAFGIIASGSSLGGVIFPIMVQRLVNNPNVGFGWTMRIAAFMIFGLLLISNLTIKSRLKPRPTPLDFKQFVAPLGELTYDLTLAGSFLFFLGMFLPINFLIVEARTIGMSQNLANYLIPVLNAASVFGRILPGWVADKVGRFNVHFVMTTFTGTIVLALWLPSSSNAPTLVFAALYGFGSGAFVSMAPATIAQISPDLSKIGVRTGTMFAIISIAALIGSPIGGALVTRWHGIFTGVQIFGGVMQLAGASFILMARISQTGLKLKAKI